MWLFYYFDFGRSNDALMSKSFLLNKNINCNKDGTEWKMENPTHNFREAKLVLQLIQESQIKRKEITIKRKKGRFLYRSFRPIRIFSRFVFYLNV